MKKLKRLFDTRIITIVVSILVFSMFTSSTYATKVEDKTVNREFEFSGLVSKKAIQNFDYASKNEVFITQREGKNTYLSRCVVSNDGKAYLKDYVILSDYGHGESIEVIKENGKTYIWIGSTVNEKPNPNGNVYYWSKDISRIEYVVDSTYATGAKVGEIKTITNIENVSSSPAGKAFRSAVAIADGSDRICFRTQIDNSSRSTYYGVYKLSEINKVLNLTSQTKINMSAFASSKVSYFKDLKCPNGSFQGFDITGVGSNNKFLYIYGGAEKQTPTIYKYLYTNGGNYTHVKTIQIIGSYVGKLEAEGIKVETNLNTNKENIFVSFKPPTDEDGNIRPFRLYSFVEGSQPNISVTSVKLNKTSTIIQKGNTEKLKATINPSDATNKDVTWTSSNTKVATVDTNGNVKAIATGSATITATTKDGSKKATCKVTVPYKVKTVQFKVDIPSAFKAKYDVEILDDNNNVLYASKGNYGSRNYKFTYTLETSSSSYIRYVRIKNNSKNYISRSFNINKSNIDKDINIIFRDDKITVKQENLVELRDNTRRIYTLDTKYTTTENLGSILSSMSKDDLNNDIYKREPEENSIYTNAHKNIQKTYDYFKKFGSKGDTNLSGGIYIFPNSNKDLGSNNINPVRNEGYIAIGKGNNKSYAYSLDVLAHEYTHLILTNKYKINGQNLKSRTVHEGVADFFGEIIENDGDWRIAETQTRNIANPSKEYIKSKTEGYKDASGNWRNKYPDKYSQRMKFPKNGEFELAYSYINSTIVSHLLYSISEGDDAFLKGFKGIGRINTGKLIFRALEDMSSTGDMKEFANQIYKNAYSSEKDSVIKALKKVELYNSVKSVKLNKTSTTLIQGRSEKLKATINPSDATNKDITWTSSNTKVATVDTNGNVKAISTGSTTIIATTKDGSKKATCKVTVKAPYKVRNISLKVNVPLTFKEKYYLQILEGNKVIYTSSAKTGSSNYNFTYQLDKESSSFTRRIAIKTVSGNKVYTSNNFKIDKNTINKDVIATLNGKNFSVIQQISVKSVKLDKTVSTINPGGTVTLKATINPTNATNKNVTWLSSNTKVATVSSKGVVKGISSGTTTITVVTKDGSKKATCKVTVKKPYKVRVIGFKVKVPSNFKDKHYIEILDENNKVLYKSGIRTGSSNLNFTYTLNQSNSSYKRKVRIRTVSGKTYTSKSFKIDKNTINKDITATYKLGKISIKQ